MKPRIVVSLLLCAAVLYVASAFCYFYEARSMGLLPVLHYPYREYVFPLAAVASTFVVISAVLCARRRCEAS